MINRSQFHLPDRSPRPVRPPWMSIFLLCLFFFCFSSLGADDLVLKNGNRISGIVEKNGDQYRVENAATTVTVPAGKVKKVVSSPSPWKEFRRKRKELREKENPTAKEYVHLAEWAGKQDFHFRRRELLQNAIEKDPDNKKARKALGFVKYEDEWMSHDEMMRRRGFRRFEGKWLPEETAKVLIRNKKEKQRRKMIRNRLNDYLLEMARTPDAEKRGQIASDMLAYGKQMNVDNIRKKVEMAENYYRKVHRKVLVERAHVTMNMNAAKASVGNVRTLRLNNLGVAIQLPRVNLDSYQGAIKVPAK